MGANQGEPYAIPGYLWILGIGPLLGAYLRSDWPEYR